jgi:hypothetical protein
MKYGSAPNHFRDEDIIESRIGSKFMFFLQIWEALRRENLGQVAQLCQVA